MNRDDLDPMTSVVDYDRDEAASERRRALSLNIPHPADCRCRPCLREQALDDLHEAMR